MRMSDWSSDVCSSDLAGKCDKLPSIQGVYVMVVRLARLAPPLECVRLYDLEAGLDGFIAIHSTTLGPGAGGCRLWSYADASHALADAVRSEEHTSELQSLMRISYAVFCLKKKSIYTYINDVS